MVDIFITFTSVYSYRPLALLWRVAESVTAVVTLGKALLLRCRPFFFVDDVRSPETAAGFCVSVSGVNCWICGSAETQESIRISFFFTALQCVCFDLY